MNPWRPTFELNVEGYPDGRFFEIVEAVRPEQCTLVPDAPTAFTSEEGWRLDAADMVTVQNAVARVHAIGSRPVVFVDPDAEIVARVSETDADGIELYTGTYAAEARTTHSGKMLEKLADAATKATTLGLVVNAGHDLNLANLPPFIAAVPTLAEASIGHELTADALILGFEASVRAYKGALKAPT